MRCRRAWAGCVALLGWLGQAGAADAPAPPPPVAKNIIVLVADGGGFNAYHAASLYQYGRLGAQPYDRPEWVKLASRTMPLSYYSSGDSGYDPSAVWDSRLDAGYAGAMSSSRTIRGYSALKQGYTDSAAAATAMASGFKTYNGRINTAGSGYGSSAYGSSSYSSSSYGSSNDGSSRYGSTGYRSSRRRGSSGGSSGNGYSATGGSSDGYSSNGSADSGGSGNGYSSNTSYGSNTGGNGYSTDNGSGYGSSSGSGYGAGSSGYSGYGNGSSSRSESTPRTETIASYARSLGRSAGVVTSVQWSDATPASFGGAHNYSRNSRREIAQEMLNSGVLDVIMGAGNPEYDRNAAPRWVERESEYDVIGGVREVELLRSGRHPRGWAVVESRSEFEALANGPAPARVVGLARVQRTLQEERQTRDWNRDGAVDDADLKVSPPFRDPFNQNVPSLAIMARGALNVLSRNEKGFFLMIEGGAADWAAASGHPGRLVEEQVAFNDAVRAVIDWVNTRSNWSETLVIITADHETGMLWGVNSDTTPFEPLNNRGAGRAPGMWFNTRSHTISLVPLYARGPGAAHFASQVVGSDPVRGSFVDNTSIFRVMKGAFGGAVPEKASTTTTTTAGNDNSTPTRSTGATDASSSSAGSMDQAGGSSTTRPTSGDQDESSNESDMDEDE